MQYKQQLSSRIDNQTARVGVVGLGYVGLPLALAFAGRGFTTLGFDVDMRKVEALSRGSSYLRHIESAAVSALVAEHRLIPCSDFERLSECDAVLICVPTPLTATRDPDLSYVVSTARHIKQALRPGQLIVLESTTYPGTTQEVLLPILEESGLRAGEDFFVAFSPEREDPGNAHYSTTTIAKVVGGCGRDAGDLAQSLYAQVIGKVVRVSGAAVAEATKITENVFRAVNIALVNELKVVFERMGIDVWEVLDAASTKPFGFMRFNPGPGWGGHCIPLDPFYLSWKARGHNADTKFIELAGEINRGMPDYVVERLQLALNDHGKSIKGSAIMLLGVAYKKDVDDTRESPAFPIATALRARGAVLSYHDPFVQGFSVQPVDDAALQPRPVSLAPEELARHDAVVVITDHSGVDYDSVLAHAKLIVDSRGVYRGPHQRVVRA